MSEFKEKTGAGMDDIYVVLKVIDPDPKRLLGNPKGTGFDKPFRAIFKSLARNVEADFNADTLSWDLCDTETTNFWVLNVGASTSSIQETDRQLKNWVETHLIVRSDLMVEDGYTYEYLSLKSKYDVYCYMKNQMLALPVEEVAALHIPDSPMEYVSFDPFPKTYVMDEPVCLDWVSQHEMWKGVVAREVLGGERYSEYVSYIRSITGQDISGLPKSWVFKAFNLEPALSVKANGAPMVDTVYSKVSSYLKDLKSLYEGDE